MVRWPFQANPKYDSIVNASQDFALMLWLVTYYAKDIAISDRVLIWFVGAKDGVYAIKVFSLNYKQGEKVCAI